MRTPDPESPREHTRARRVLSSLGIMAVVATVLGVLTAGLAMPLVAAVGINAKNAAETMDDLPLDLETRPLAEKTSVLDVEGNLIASFYDENRVNVTLSEIAKPMVQAIVSIEDYRFYEHGAIDLKGTLRALITNQANSGTVVQGGSSITQQMVKLTLVDQAETKEEREQATEDSYARKITELRYAIAFEQKHSKDWILERYLNIAYFGDGAYGVQAAARKYFGKNASKLTVKEAATLAGLVKNPVGYDPTTYPDRALARRNVVLNRMAQLNVIDQAEADRLKEKDLGLKVQSAANGCVNSQASFFCDYVYRYLLEDVSLGKTKDERKALLRSGGLTIRTTVDLRFQKAADKSVAAHVKARDGAIGALAMVEPRTGNVKALAQSRPMGDNKKRGQTYLNHTVPTKFGDSAGFQGGSTFKAFVMAAALQTEKVAPSKAYNSPLRMIFNLQDFKDCNDEPYGYGTFPVESSTGAGVMNMYNGTRTSNNTYYLQLTRDVGICSPFKTAKKLGIQLDNPYGDAKGNGREMTPNFGLGAANSSPLETAEAYASFAARGLHCESRSITSIEDANGNILKKYPKKCTQVLRTDVADTINDILRGVQEPGGFGYQAGLGLPQQSAGKTGTAQNNRAVWFAGYTPNLSTAALIAGVNKKGEPESLKGKTVAGVYLTTASGSRHAGPVWGDAMKAVAPYLKDETFVNPQGGRGSNPVAKAPERSEDDRRSGAGDSRGPQARERGNGGGNDGGRGNGRGNGGGNGGGRDRR